MKWLFVLALSQLVDIGTTGYGLSRGNREANPLVLAIIHSGGLLPLLLSKMAIVVFAAFVIYRLSRYGYGRLASTVVCWMAIAIFLVSGWNLFIGLIA
jgi:hypothetical protein